MKPFSYAIWLVPCAEQRRTLQEIIKSLAAEFGASVFMPHATLCSGVWKSLEEELIATVDRVSPELPVKLSVTGMDWTDHWSTYFFLQLQCETDLFEQPANFVPGTHTPAVGPHLSLLYGMGTQSVDRKKLRATLDVPPVVLFDTLALVRPETGRWQDIVSWKTLYTIR